MIKENEILFSEKQHFSPWIVWGTLVIALLPLAIGLYSYWNGATTGTAMGKGTLFVVTVITLLVTTLLASSKLETVIKQEGIQVRLFPFQIKYRNFSWEEIDTVEVRKYNPLFEYGGWGIKGFAGNRALNMKGDMGMQLVFKNGDRLLIGTGKPEELKNILSRLSVLRQ
jgi:hypothetical protein